MIKKYLFVGLGFVFFGLGAVGALVPVLPTTPFLLLAAYFFARGSEKFNRWFLSTDLYKKHLESFLETRSMTIQTKAGILGLASAMMISTFVLLDNTYIRGLLAFLILFMYYYFAFQIKTIRKEEEV